MIFFFVYPRAGDKTITFNTGLIYVSRDPKFLFEPVEIVVSTKLRLRRGARRYGIRDNFLKDAHASFRHIACNIQLALVHRPLYARNSMRFGPCIPRDRDGFVPFRYGERPVPRYNSDRSCRLWKIRLPWRQACPRRFYVRMSCVSETIPPKLVCHN